MNLRNIFAALILALPLCGSATADVLGEIKNYPVFSVSVGIVDPKNPASRPVIELGWSRATGSLAFSTSIYQELAPGEGGAASPIRSVPAKASATAIFAACKEFSGAYVFPTELPSAGARSIGTQSQSYVSFGNGDTKVRLAITDKMLPAAREIQALILAHMSEDQKKWLEWTPK